MAWRSPRVSRLLWVALALAPIRAGAAGSNDSAAPGYADLVDLLEPAPLVLTVQIRKVAQVEPDRAKSIRPGWARIYVEAQGLAALRGKLPPVPTLSYLADVRLDARGKLPPLAKQSVLLVARPVAAHPEMLQLVTPVAQLPGDPTMMARVRAVLGELQAPDAPGVITGVREAISEVVDATGKPPAHDTLAWYRLACVLPPQLPGGTNVSVTDGDRAQAVDDYHLVIAGLGPCGRMN